MLPAVVVTCGLSLLPLSDANVKFWDLDHSALNHFPAMGPNRVLTDEEKQVEWEEVQKELKRMEEALQERIRGLERQGADPEQIRRAKEGHSQVLDQIRRLNDAIEKLEREK